LRWYTKEHYHKGKERKRDEIVQKFEEKEIERKRDEIVKKI
jgi:hypothetical protein